MHVVRISEGAPGRAWVGIAKIWMGLVRVNSALSIEYPRFDVESSTENAKRERGRKSEREKECVGERV